MNLHTVEELQEIDVRDGLRLRTLRAEDAAGLLGVIEADEEIRRRVGVAASLQEAADVQEVIARAAADPGLLRHVIERGNTVIGLVSFWRNDGFLGQPPDDDEYGFGFFVDPAYRGQGIVTASVQRLIDTSTRLLKPTAFIAFSEDDNTPSIAVLERLGFRRTDEMYGEPNTGWRERKYVRTIEANAR